MNVNNVQNERVQEEYEAKYIKENFYTYSDWHGMV